MKTEEPFHVHPIGYFSGPQTEKYMAPRQASWGSDGKEGVILLNPGSHYEQALEDLEGFERIWIIYLFHRNSSWKPKVETPRSGSKKGVFATRSPHRPNPIGISCVKLLRIDGLRLFIGSNDLIDGTPVLDIKPYLNYSDAFPESKQGWLETEPETVFYRIEWHPIAQEQLAFIRQESTFDIETALASRLSTSPFPKKNNRIKALADGSYVIAVKTWRFHFIIKEFKVMITRVFSGYDTSTLIGTKPSKWDDVPLHKRFVERFHLNEGEDSFNLLDYAYH